MPFKGFLEKKNTLQIWAKKYASFEGTKLSLSEAEGQEPFLVIDLVGITRGGESGDPLVLVCYTSAGDTQVRACSPGEAAEWYGFMYDSLVAVGRAKPRHSGLPAVDPRNNLDFVDIPAQFATRFVNLERAVLYWFSSVKKYGNPSKITKKFSMEDRVGFCGDKAFYVTKPNSEVTRCIKIVNIKAMFTNVGVKEEKDEAFIVFKMPTPDFDLYISHPTVPKLLEAIKGIYRYNTHGKEPEVRQVKNALDPAVQLQLTRPSNFEMVMVVPTTKDQLKKALDKFAAKHGITFAPAPNQNSTASFTADKSPSLGASAPPSAPPKAEMEAPPAPAKPAAEEVPATDPLGCFLLKLRLGKFYQSLYKNQVDLDVLEVMDDTDLNNFGVKDPAAISTIRSKLADLAFMEEVKADVESARAGKNWNRPVQPEEEAPAAASNGGGAVELDDDDDLDVPVAPKNTNKVPIILDDSDDDLLPPAKAEEKFAIVLDSDDDSIELPPAKPAAAAPVTLSDDDDI